MSSFLWCIGSALPHVHGGEWRLKILSWSCILCLYPWNSLSGWKAWGQLNSHLHRMSTRDPCPQGSISTRIHVHRDPWIRGIHIHKGSMSTRDPRPQGIHLHKDHPNHVYSLTIPCFPRWLWALGTAQGSSGFIPPSAVKFLQGGKAGTEFYQTLSDKKDEEESRRKYWGLQAKRETCRENPNPPSASLQLKASAQLKQSVCGKVLHSLK